MESKRNKFKKTVPAPYVCFFCEQPVTNVSGKMSGDSLVGHHKDGNHDNDDPSNWVAAHNSCHTRHHFRGKEKSLEQRMKTSASMEGNQNWRSAEVPFWKHRR